MDVRVGDKVKRISGGWHGGLDVGDTAIVSDVIDENTIMLKGHGDWKFYIPNFKIIREEEKEKEIPNVSNVSEIAKQLEGLKATDTERQISRLKDNIKSYEESVENGRKHMDRYYKKIREAMLEIKRLEQVNEDKVDFSSEVENILNHKYVEGMIVTGSKSFNIYTDYIDIYDEDGNRFRGNKYRLEFNFNDMECRIYGIEDDLCRKSYWTKHDPHPHVNGESGRACWGDAGSMLSMNMNEFELYASFIVVLNFLQQVNTSDPAGEYICNWDCIDDDNNDIENPYENVNFAKCTVCDENLSEDEATYCDECGEYCCDSHAYWIDDNQWYVCEHCYDNYYGRCAHCGERFHEEGLTDIKGDTYCEHCRDELFIQCDNCEEYEPNDRVFCCEGCGRNFCLDCEEEQDGLCSECYEEREEEEDEC